MKNPRKLVLIGLDSANPNLMMKYMEDGELPNLKRLTEEGAFSKILPSVPCNTSVNWTTIATGSNPGTHGITDFWIHLPGEPLDKIHDTFDSTLVNAEHIWDVADKEGLRSVVMNYPGSYPMSMKNGIFVGGEGRPSSGSTFELRSPSCFVSEKAEDGTERASVIEFQQKGEGLESSISITPSGGNAEGPKYMLKLPESENHSYTTLEVRDQKGKVKASLEANSWSDWLTEDFVVGGTEVKGTFRIYLTDLSSNGEEFKLYISQVMPATPYKGFLQPEELLKELHHEAGPIAEYCGAGPYRRGWHDLQAWFDEMEYKAKWMAQATPHIINNYDADLFLSHFHMLDHVYHYIWGGFDPATNWFTENERAKYEEKMLEAHKIADKMVGEIVKRVGDDANYIVISDHGQIPHVKSVSINNLLAKEGMIAYEEGPNNEPIIDWDNTYAYKPTDAAHIWINLKGRDPQGVVTEEEYEETQAKIIDALLRLRDPDNRKRPVALAVKKKDAVPYGLWGERTGDVVFLMNDEYTAMLGAPLSNDGRVVVEMGPEEEGKSNFHAPDFQAYHGCTSPTTELGREGSEAGMFLLSGPDSKNGIYNDQYVNMTDVTPTIARLIGIQEPETAEGQVLNRYLKK